MSNFVILKRERKILISCFLSLMKILNMNELFELADTAYITITQREK